MATSTASSTISLTGASRQKYDFTLYRWGTEFKPACVVYAIFTERSDGYHVIYIGQTGDCSSRFDAHHKASCFTRNGATHIGLRVVSAERDRLAVEADLIAAYHPSCNG